MEILPGMEIVDLGLWLKKEKILVVSDFHLGYEEMLEDKGLLVPRFQLKEVTKRLEKILKRVKPKKIIINGDLKHEFGRILNQEWKDSLRLVDFLLKSCGELVLVKGNHDLFLGAIAGKRGLKIVDDCLINGILIVHGDKLKKINKKIKTIIIGHEHPAVGLREKGKAEKYKCFLKGKFEGKNLIVLPSFNLLFEGTDITKEELLSPYLRDIKGFEAYVVGEEEVLGFGLVANLP